MFFTTKAEYGVRLLIELGRQPGNRPVSLKSIADTENLPLAYLERIVALLKRANLVESTRGAHGGYQLSRSPEDIAMNEVVLALEGTVAPMNCFVEEEGDGRVLCSHHDDSGRGCATKLLWTRVQANVLKTLADTTLAELVEFQSRQLTPARVTRAGDHHRLRPKETMPELEIRNLHVQAEDKQILKGVNLTVTPGEIHALMGPNGSGKSTLANAIMGHPNLTVSEGQILFGGEDITEADTDERSRMGLFMAFQYPVAIPGVTITKYLRMVMNSHREARGEPDISLKEFRKTVEAAMELVNVPREFSSRYLNEGFSGGEKKRLEILQLALQNPKLAILDETDSGLDIDALNVVAHGVNTIAAGADMGVLIITHYQRILHMVTPTKVSIMFEGRIATDGGPELVDRLEAEGYAGIREEFATPA